MTMFDLGEELKNVSESPMYGLLSAFIMLVFPVLTVMTMPGLFGMDGVWFSRSVTAMMGFGCSVFAFIWGKKKYHYMN